MKKIIIALMLIAAATAAHSQNVTRDSKGNYIATAARKDTAAATNTGKTYTDTKGNSYPVYVSAKGKLFVYRISKTGNKYKQYLKL